MYAAVPRISPAWVTAGDVIVGSTDMLEDATPVGSMAFARPGKRRAFDQLHDERPNPVWPDGEFIEAVNRRDVRMIEGSQRPRFAIETRQAIRVLRHGLWRHLNGDLTAEPAVGGAIHLHLSHATRADLPDDFV
jgi:hypothetical protein